MTLNVHLLYQPDQETLGFLRTLLDGSVNLTLGDAMPDPAGVHILVGGRPRREHLSAAVCLKALIIPWAGLPDETAALLADFPDLAVHNLHHNAAPVAELAMTLLLAAAKRVVPFDQALRRHDWTPRYEPSPSLLLAGKTALIVGYGAIGRRVARLCQAFDMRVAATRRGAIGRSEIDGVAVHPASALDDLLPQTNVLMVCLPLTAETRGAIGGRQLSLLKPASLLVNIGRGPVIDEMALYEALRDGTIGAAGLDVWFSYPDVQDPATRSHTAPSRYPFHELDNVVMSPHRAGGSDETNRLRMRHLAELLNEAAAGRPIPNRIDLTVGY